MKYAIIIILSLLFGSACVGSLKAPDTIAKENIPKVRTTEPMQYDYTPPTPPQLPYSLYSWQDEMVDGQRQIVLYGENLTLFDKLQIGENTTVPLTHNEEGTISRAPFPEGISDGEYLFAIGNLHTHQLDEIFINDKNEIPKLSKCNFSSNINLFETCVLPTIGKGIQFRCAVTEVDIRSSFTTAYVGDVVISPQQIKSEDGFVIGFITEDQSANLESGIPFFIDFGLGQKSLSDNLFYLPD